MKNNSLACSLLVGLVACGGPAKPVPATTPGPAYAPVTTYAPASPTACKNPVVGAKLDAELAQSNPGPYAIGATFSAPPTAAIDGFTLDGLSGSGRLTRAALEQLCKLPETTHVDLLPELKLK